MSKSIENLVPELREKARAALTVHERINIKTIDAANDAVTESFNQVFGAQSVAIPTPRITPKEKEVTATIKECDLLAEKHSNYEEEFIVRGNKALYDLLQGIYGVALRINKSEFRLETISMLRSALSERNIKTQLNTPDLTILIKYIVGSNRRNAANYSRVLRIALEDKVPADALSSYVSRRGGMSQVQTTEGKANSKQSLRDTNKEKLALVKEFLFLSQFESGVEFEYNKPITVCNAARQTSSETSTFCFFLADFDSSKNVYRIIQNYDLGRSYEDNVLRFIIKDAANDLDAIKGGVDRLKNRLVKRADLPAGVADRIRQDLNNPKLAA